MYRCATCGANHRKVETAKKCAKDMARRGTRERAVKVYDSSTGRVVRNLTAQEKSYDYWATSGRAEHESAAVEEADRLWDTEVPNGYYVIPRDSWPPNGLRIHVRQFDTGRWMGVWFITDLGSDKPELVSGSVSDRQFIIAKLIGSGPLYCMTQYGRLTGRCGICNEELTEDEREKYAGHIECFQPVWEQSVLNP